MTHKKRYPWIRVLPVFLLAAVFGLAGCGAAARLGESGSSDPGRGFSGQRKLTVVTTIFPYYDFTRQIGGDDIHLTMVVPAGMDSHSFEPTPADMRTIQSADLLICNGGVMETWVCEVLEAIDNSQMHVVTMMDYVDIVEEEIVEGMEEDDHTHGHRGHDSHDHDGHEEAVEYDEHIWTSPTNAMLFVKVIRDELSRLDPVHAAGYDERAEAYCGELAEIDAGFCKVRDNRIRNMIVVGDKFPFRYLAKEYDLDYRAAFSGCSTDTEPSARTIAYLIEKIRKERIPVIYYLELSSRRVAEIISEETGAIPLLLHSCHNVTRQELDAGITYGELMRKNIENLRRGIDE